MIVKSFFYFDKKVKLKFLLFPNFIITLLMKSIFFTVWFIKNRQYK